MYYVIAKSETGSRFAFISPSLHVKAARADVERLIGFFNEEASKTDTKPVQMVSGMRTLDNVDKRFGLNELNLEMLYTHHFAICKYLGTDP